ncbi:hypothetical protein ABZX12_17870 [Kribbella sp. NPDC003505]|uniref:hypothetical protein n=1 Tax=Kribbella sp. NPDC003505 TaxID=3154448 RepID=UPI0033AC10E2
MKKRLAAVVMAAVMATLGLGALATSSAVAAPPTTAAVTKPPSPRTAANLTSSCPVVSGQRVKEASYSSVYLVDPWGYLRYIPSDVYFKLWDSYAGIQTVANDSLDSCVFGTSMYGAQLVKESGINAVYIWDNANAGYPSGFDWITSSAVFNKYGFSWSKITTYNYVGPKNNFNWFQ